MEVVNIYNPNLPNQCLTSRLISQGLSSQGISVETTPDTNAFGDVTVIHGPNYALKKMLGRKNVIWLDRCWYGDTNDNASIGWLDTDLNRVTPKRVWPLKTFSDKRLVSHNVYVDKYVNTPNVLILDDYDETLLNTAPITTFDSLHYRSHPLRSGIYPSAIPRNEGTLNDALIGIGLVITAAGTSGAYAALKGIPTICFDPSNIVFDISSHNLIDNSYTDERGRKQWAANLAWKQWSNEEIASGKWWAVLQSCYHS